MGQIGGQTDPPNALGCGNRKRCGSVWSFTYRVAMRVIVTDPDFPLCTPGYAAAHPPRAAPNDLRVVSTASAAAVSGVIIIRLLRGPRTHHIEGVRPSARDLKEVFAVRTLPARRIGSALDQGR